MTASDASEVSETVHKIFVTPLDSGWLMRQDTAGQGLVFGTGARAEAAARRLARAFSDVGAGAEIVIYLRDGTLAGRIVSPPAPPSDMSLAG